MKNHRHPHEDKAWHTRFAFGLLLFLGLVLPLLVAIVFPFVKKSDTVKGPPLHAHIQLMEHEKAQKESLEKSR